MLGGGCAEKETTMAKERWWKAPGMVVLTSTKTNIVFGLHWLGEPRAARWPQNELLARLVGEEASHGLMRDGGGPSIRGGLRPDHHKEICARRSLAEKKRQVKGMEGGHEGGIEGKRSK